MAFTGENPKRSETGHSRLVDPRVGLLHDALEAALALLRELDDVMESREAVLAMLRSFAEEAIEIFTGTPVEPPGRLFAAAASARRNGSIAEFRALSGALSEYLAN